MASGPHEAAKSSGPAGVRAPSAPIPECARPPGVRPARRPLAPRRFGPPPPRRQAPPPPRWPARATGRPTPSIRARSTASALPWSVRARTAAARRAAASLRSASSSGRTVCSSAARPSPCSAAAATSGSGSSAHRSRCGSHARADGACRFDGGDAHRRRRIPIAERDERRGGASVARAPRGRGRRSTAPTGPHPRAPAAAPRSPPVRPAATARGRRVARVLAASDCMAVHQRIDHARIIQVRQVLDRGAADWFVRIAQRGGEQLIAGLAVAEVSGDAHRRLARARIGVAEHLDDALRHLRMADRVQGADRRQAHRRVAMRDQRDQRFECGRVADSGERAGRGDQDLGIVIQRAQQRRGRTAIADAPERGDGREASGADPRHRDARAAAARPGGRVARALPRPARGHVRIRQQAGQGAIDVG